MFSEHQSESSRTFKEQEEMQKRMKELQTQVDDLTNTTAQKDKDIESAQLTIQDMDKEL